MALTAPLKTAVVRGPGRSGIQPETVGLRNRNSERVVRVAGPQLRRGEEPKSVGFSTARA